MRKAIVPIKEGYNTVEVRQYIIEKLKGRVDFGPGYWQGTSEYGNPYFREMVADLRKIKDGQNIDEYPQFVNRVIDELDHCKGIPRIADIAEAINHPDTHTEDSSESIKRDLRSLVEKRYIPDRAKLTNILTALQGHEYHLHGGGKELDGKRYAKSAAIIIEKIQALLASEVDFSDPVKVQAAKAASEALVLDIEAELKDKTMVTNGFLHGGGGAREQSTVDLYKNILKLARPTSESLTEDSEKRRLSPE